MLGGFLFARPLALPGVFGTQKGPPDPFVGFDTAPRPVDQKWQRVLCLWGARRMLLSNAFSRGGVMLKLLGFVLMFVISLASVQAATSAQVAQKNTAIKKHVSASLWPEGAPRFSPLYSRVRWNDRVSQNTIATHDIRITLQALEAGFFSRAKINGDVLGEPSGDYSDAAWIREGFANQFSGMAALEKNDFDAAIVSFDVARGFFDRTKASPLLAARTRLDKQMTLYIQAKNKFILGPEVISLFESQAGEYPIDFAIMNELIKIDAHRRKDSVSEKSAEENVVKSLARLKSIDKNATVELKRLFKLVESAK